jgi:uncharacterized membrane protein
MIGREALLGVVLMIGVCGMIGALTLAGAHRDQLGTALGAAVVFLALTVWSAYEMIHDPRE